MIHVAKPHRKLIYAVETQTEGVMLTLNTSSLCSAKIIFKFVHVIPVLSVIVLLIFYSNVNFYLYFCTLQKACICVIFPDAYRTIY